MLPNFIRKTFYYFTSKGHRDSIGTVFNQSESSKLTKMILNTLLKKL